MNRMTGKVELQIDPNVGAAYIQLNDSAVVRTVEVTDSVLIDLDAMDMVVGIEVLSLSAEIPVGPLMRDWHIHSDVVSALQNIRPSVSGFVALFSSVGGAAVGVGEGVAQVRSC
ncbi:DUF2283 domain-containing protein [Nocardia bovistercoris]|uniref:DUF2283 domain-containing protein n=1 Tax=Nocardia bovistercoris TaxID=2785916 RepID=A0A931I5J0_9NOCA|nr:DUF2283 domain-containing protein [Nocardia bovistercoris]MBH0775242.1 DUF2283 domain-containing protein [Nocardia bovistercoris]